MEINIREKLKNYERVLRLSRKPKKEEFVMVAKITGLGMLVIGIVGFLIRLIVQLIEYLGYRG